MINIRRRFNLANESALYQLFVSICIIMGVGFALSTVLTVAGILLSGGNLSMVMNPDGIFKDNNISFVRYMLVVQDVSLLIVPALLVFSLMRSENGKSLEIFGKPDLQEVVMVLFLTVCIIPLSNFTGQLNSQMQFPDWMSGIEKWITEKEQNADDILSSLITAGTFPLLLLNLVIIALLPAIAEEMIFRGIFQKIFIKLFRSGHSGVFVTAVIFSAIHLQFYGFLPRLILGLIFGYLFYWGGKLWLPVISHFVNNAIPLVLVYLHGTDSTDLMSGLPLWKQAIILPVPVTLIVMILIYMRNRARKVKDK